MVSQASQDLAITDMAPSRRSPLDPTSFPHLVDAICAFLDTADDCDRALHALRATCRSLKDHVDRHLVKHITVIEVTGKLLVMSKSLCPLPVFAHPRRNLFLAPIVDSPGRVALQRSLLSHTRVVDVTGQISPGLMALFAAGLVRVEVVRFVSPPTHLIRRWVTYSEWRREPQVSQLPFATAKIVYFTPDLHYICDPSSLYGQSPLPATTTTTAHTVVLIAPRVSRYAWNMLPPHYSNRQNDLRRVVVHFGNLRAGTDVWWSFFLQDMARMLWKKTHCTFILVDIDLVPPEVFALAPQATRVQLLGSIRRLIREALAWNLAVNLEGARLAGSELCARADDMMARIEFVSSDTYRARVGERTYQLETESVDESL